MFSRAPLIPTTVIALAAISLLAAGCGSKSAAPASSNQSASAHSIQPAIHFTACMRAHRVPDFPDPTTSPRAWKDALNPSTPHSPAFLAAVAACQHLLPVGPRNQSPAHSRTQIAAALAFARCMRSHGFPSMPDPTSTGDITHQMIAAAGIDLHQPALVQAADACVPVTHGYITKAAVARFVAGN
jgi:hypothetical protein